MKLLIATTNPAKLEEIRDILSDLPVTCVGLSDVGITDQVEETGETFEENAILKAKTYAKLSGLPTLADDGGLEIDALGGKPGVHSHRWATPNRDGTDEELINFTLEKLKGLPRDKRGAQLRVVEALVLPNGDTHTSEGVIRGMIPEKPSSYRKTGFPYRSLLFLPQIGKFYNHDELTPKEHSRYNHRKKALEKIKQVIREHLE